MKVILPCSNIGKRAICVILALAATGSFSNGIPEPGIVLYGVVSEAGTGNPITIGMLQIIYADPFGRSITNAVALQNLAGGYSYVTEIPFESAVSGNTVGANAFTLPVSGAPAQTLSRTANYAYATGPATLQQGNADTISFSQKGKLLRLDLMVTASDSNVSGLPDYWQLQYFGQLGVDPNADPDHDGVSNRQEYLAGTDPTDPNSLFKLTSIAAALVPQRQIDSVKIINGIATIAWGSVTGQTFRLQYKSRLTDAAWTDVAPDVTATGLQTSVTNGLDGSPQRFYRFQLVQTAGGVTLRWKSVTGKKYTVLRSTGATQAYSPIAANIQATPPENVFTDSSPDAKAAFYRVSTP